MSIPRRYVVVTVSIVAQLVLAAPAAIPAHAAGTVTPTHVTPTNTWRKPSPDPMGIAYHPWSGSLVVVDSEVEETRLWAGANVWSITASAHPTRSWRSTRFSAEPTDVTFRAAKTMFVSDDRLNRIFVVSAGKDRRFGSRDDLVRSFSTKTFGSQNPQGLAYGDGTLFLADGSDARVYRIDPGADRRFDGGGPSGDDVVTSFTTDGVDITSPSGVAFDAASRNLYLVSQNAPLIVAVTTTGTFVESYDIAASGIAFASGIELSPSSDDPTVTAAYVTDRGIDNDFSTGGDPNENDGRIFEFVLGSA